jgi:hypothetical protein
VNVFADLRPVAVPVSSYLGGLKRRIATPHSYLLIVACLPALRHLPPAEKWIYGGGQDFRGDHDRYDVRLRLKNVVFELACTAEKEVEVERAWRAALYAAA